MDVNSIVSWLWDKVVWLDGMVQGWISPTLTDKGAVWAIGPAGWILTFFIIWFGLKLVWYLLFPKR